MAYRSRESKIIVGCRLEYGITNRTYEEYDLQIRYSDQGKSSSAPTLSEFNGRLYIFWKANVGARPGAIVYTSTEDGEKFDGPEVTQFQTGAAPTAVHYKSRLYLAYCNQQNEILISSSLDGKSWSAAALQHLQASQANITSPYPPSFGVINDKLVLFWGGGQPEKDAVLYANLDTDNLSQGVLTGVKKVDQGLWQTKLGNGVAYRSDNQWLVTTSKNGEISIATNGDFDSRSNLTDHTNRKSSTVCGVCLVPGYFGRVNQEEWGLTVVYRGFGQDSKLYEVSIGRSKARYERTIEQLEARVKTLEAEKAQALKELAECKVARDTLQAQVTQLNTVVATLKEAADGKVARDQLQAWVRTYLGVRR